MASSKGDQPRKKGGMPNGVRGPGGPPAAPVGKPTPPSSRLGSPPTTKDGWRRTFEQRSYPVLQRLHSIPRWIVVVAPALLLFLGLVLTGGVAWLGGIMLLIVWLFVAWLTALSWPALTPGSRLFRALVVLALLGIVVMKFLGKF